MNPAGRMYGRGNKKLCGSASFHKHHKDSHRTPSLLFLLLVPKNGQKGLQISTSKPSSFFVSLSERLIIAATHMNIFIFIFILFDFYMFFMLAIHEYNLHTILVPTFSKYDKLHTYSWRDSEPYSQAEK